MKLKFLHFANQKQCYNYVIFFSVLFLKMNVKVICQYISVHNFPKFFDTCHKLLTYSLLIILFLSFSIPLKVLNIFSNS